MAEQQAPGLWRTDLRRQDLSVRLGRFTRYGMPQRQRGGTRHLCRGQRQAASHAGRVSASLPVRLGHRAAQVVVNQSGRAALVAVHRGLYWRTSEGLQLDSGAFVTGLEHAAAIKAEVVGKPAAAFFDAALAHLGAGAADTVMVGDDIETDVLAAQRHGLTGVLVKTGKYLPSTHRAATGTPDHVLDSFASLPALLEQPP
jgi:ribonucleotide monophosphatase NagD (HAD superfamily)